MPPSIGNLLGAYLARGIVNIPLGACDRQRTCMSRNGTFGRYRARGQFCSLCGRTGPV